MFSENVIAMKISSASVEANKSNWTLNCEMESNQVFDYSQTPAVYFKEEHINTDFIGIHIIVLVF